MLDRSIVLRFAVTHRHASALILAAALLLGTFASLSGLAEHLDRILDPLRVAASVKPPSGRIVVIDMDADSVAAIKSWPWPRHHYARVIDRLSAAGAASITFDVDFSSASTPIGDRAMAEALARAKPPIALPTFAQQARSGDRRSIDALPLPLFRDHAALASVSMQPDSDGIVRRAPFGTVTDGVPRPSVSSFMAHRSGSADAFFPIDFGTDREQLPRLSFVAVEAGRFAPAAIRGKDVVIGATAIEMGDRYAVPYWGVIPGVIIQALAAETLLRAVPVDGSTMVVLLVAAVLAMGLLASRTTPVAIAVGIAAPLALFGMALGAQLAFHRLYPLAAGLVVLAIVSVARIGLNLMARFDRQRSVDEETGLPNRHAMVRDAAQRAAAPIAVVLVNNFSTVVTLLGTAAGHDLMLRLAERLALVGAGAVYRLDDRLLAFELTAAPAELPEAVAQVQQLLARPVEIAGRPMDAAVHVGVSGAADDMSVRLAAATHAAGQALDRRTFWQHSDVDVEALELRLVLMGELDHAIGSGQIEVHYQPKLALADDRITSVEALVRWRHPERGMVRPDLFIPLAEEADRIGPLTLFVLGRVIDDLAGWRQAGIDLCAAVNLSAMLIAEPTFQAAVSELLDDGDVQADRLIFEVTESATLANPEQAALHLRGFRDRGVAISMDDYGTGQSTLTYLRQLPLSELKIDRSFVQHAHLNRADELMVRSTIDLAHNLGLKVVAEGIEEEGCLNLLRQAGCDMAQGYLISRPLPAGDLQRLLIEGLRGAWLRAEHGAAPALPSFTA
ncbi:EAL domain-containing protein [Sphingomonas sp. GC_Shp_4]|uniref:putative bifunctional diguanylate cyclase/phosphodiesterase n=1 Tax=Sphingomonas sp. GC_Shp_4 TaxID=2937382 RepID=UPI00226B18BA|nr:EAL domain-containing protein [Sphingomonas sp. GC_Shp_4]